VKYFTPIDLEYQDIYHYLRKMRSADLCHPYDFTLRSALSNLSEIRRQGKYISTLFNQESRASAHEYGLINRYQLGQQCLFMMLQCLPPSKVLEEFIRGKERDNPLIALT